MFFAEKQGKAVFQGEKGGATELYYYRFRHYDPEIGRFISEDPIGFAAEDYNIYRYVWNSPGNWIDPLGLINWTTWGAGALVIAYSALGISFLLLLPLLDNLVFAATMYKARLRFTGWFEVAKGIVFTAILVFLYPQ